MYTMMHRVPRIVVAGQLPPPHGGQNVMVGELLSDLRQGGASEVIHLPFRFARGFGDMGRPSARKVVSVLRVIVAGVQLRLKGRIHCLVYPVGGATTASLIRDLLLIPFFAMISRGVVLHFHGAGHAARLADRPLMRLVCGIAYRRAKTAVVMTAFNRADPSFLGIREIRVFPHALDDEYQTDLVRRDGAPRILYVGHLGPQRGTPALIDAFADISDDYPDAILELVGECVYPYTDDQLQRCVTRSGAADRVTIQGVLTGIEKWRAFGRADLFVFPSVFPAESFGLVLVEAMMWSLPIVATDWRGNSDVLGDDFGGICFEVAAVDLRRSLSKALRSALANRLLLTTWGSMNREIFNSRYNKRNLSTDLVQFIEGMAARTGDS